MEYSSRGRRRHVARPSSQTLVSGPRRLVLRPLCGVQPLELPPSPPPCLQEPVRATFAEEHVPTEVFESHPAPHLSTTPPVLWWEHGHRRRSKRAGIAHVPAIAQLLTVALHVLAPAFGETPPWSGVTSREDYAQQRRAASDEVLDFAGGNGVESEEEVLKGVIEIEGEIPLGLVMDVKPSVYSTLVEVAEVGASQVQISAAFGIPISGPSADGVPRAILYFHYYLLPPRLGAHVYAEKIRDSARGDPLSSSFGSKLMYKMGRVEATTNIFFNVGWRIEIPKADVLTMEVLRPPIMLIATTTFAANTVVMTPTEGGESNVAPGNAGFLGSGGATTGNQCAREFLPCGCAAQPLCMWVPDGDSSTSNCVLKQDRNSGGVSCTDCPTQDHCPAMACLIITSPCTCASAPADCRWDDLSNRCVNRMGGSTHCRSCPSQATCELPTVVEFEPPLGTKLVLPDHIQLRIRFDKNIKIGQTGTISFFCTGQGVSLDLPNSQLEVEGKVLLVSVQMIVNGGPEDGANGGRQCDLRISRGRIEDTDGVPFAGLGPGKRIEYNFKLGDSVAPKVVDFEPRNGQTGIEATSAAVTITFNEAIRLASTGAGLKGKLTPLEVSTGTEEASSAGKPSAEDMPDTHFLIGPPRVVSEEKRLVLDLAGLVEPGVLYSLVLPKGAVTDLASNQYSGLLYRAYVFRTSPHIPNDIPAGSNEVAITQIVLLAILVVMIGLCCICGIAGWQFVMLRQRLLSKTSVVHPMPTATERSSLRHSRTSRSFEGAQSSKASRFADPAPSGTSSARTSALNPQANSVGDAVPSGTSSARNDTFNPQAAHTTHQAPPSPTADTSRRWQQATAHVRRAGVAAAAFKEATGTSAERRRSPVYARSSARAGGGAGRGQPDFEEPRHGGSGEQPGSGRRSRSPGRNSNGSGSSGGASPPSPSSPKSPASPAGGKSRRAPGGNRAGPGASTPLSVESATCDDDPSEAQKLQLQIETRLRGMMEAPIEERRKTLKELMFEYHPDKNSEEHAKEVFQFINAAKSWFLAET